MEPVLTESAAMPSLEPRDPSLIVTLDSLQEQIDKGPALAAEVAPLDEQKTQLGELTGVLELQEPETAPIPAVEARPIQMQPEDVAALGEPGIPPPYEPVPFQWNDAMVPGAVSAGSTDIDTLKHDLTLREQDVMVLGRQLMVAKNRIEQLEASVAEERNQNTDHLADLELLKRQNAEYEREKKLALQGLRSEMDEIKQQSKVSSERARSLETELKEAREELDRIKARVRHDIAKIRVREKELENRLEILKKDSHVLLQARENRIVELKRKLDLADFNLDLAQDQCTKEKQVSAQLHDKLNRALQAVRLAGGLLHSDEKSEHSEEVKSPGQNEAA